jgi:hypothetical protein
MARSEKVALFLRGTVLAFFTAVSVSGVNISKSERLVTKLGSFNISGEGSGADIF